MLKRLKSKLKAGSAKRSLDSSATNSPPNRPDPGYILKKTNVKKLPKLHRAAWKGKWEKLDRQLMRSRSSCNQVDKRKRTALHLAVCKQNIHIVELLVDTDGGASLLMQDDEGNNPLHKSIECGRFEITMSLIKLPTSGEAVTMCNQMGRTPLHLAAQLNDVETAIELLQIGAAIDGKDIDGHSPLALAVFNNGFEFVLLLQKEHAIADVTNNKGETPLTHAVRANNLEMVQKLLTFSCINPVIPDDVRMSPLDYAKQLNYTEICNELERNLAETPEIPPIPQDCFSDSEIEYHNPPQQKEDRKTLLARFRAEQRAKKLLLEDGILDTDDLEVLTIETEDHTGTGKAEDPINKIGVANEAAPLEQCWITPEEDVIPEKKDNSPKPLPNQSSDEAIVTQTKRSVPVIATPPSIYGPFVEPFTLSRVASTPPRVASTPPVSSSKGNKSSSKAAAIDDVIETRAKNKDKKLSPFLSRVAGKTKGTIPTNSATPPGGTTLTNSATPPDDAPPPSGAKPPTGATPSLGSPIKSTPSKSGSLNRLGISRRPSTRMLHSTAQLSPDDISSDEGNLADNTAKKRTPKGKWRPPDRPPDTITRSDSLLQGSDWYPPTEGTVGYLQKSEEDKEKLIDVMDINELKLSDRLREQQKSVDLNAVALQETKQELTHVMELLADRTNKYKRLREKYKQLKVVSDDLKKTGTKYQQEEKMHFDTYEIQISELQKKLMDALNERDDALRDKTEVQSQLESTRKEMAIFETNLKEEKVTSNRYLQEKLELETKVKQLDEEREAAVAVKVALEKKSKPSEYEQVVQNAAKSFKTFLNVGEEKDSTEKEDLQSFESQVNAISIALSENEIKITQLNNELDLKKRTNSDLVEEMETLREDVKFLEQCLEDKHFKLEEEQERGRTLSESLVELQKESYGQVPQSEVEKLKTEKDRIQRKLNSILKNNPLQRDLNVTLLPIPQAAERLLPLPSPLPPILSILPPVKRNEELRSPPQEVSVQNKRISLLNRPKANTSLVGLGGSSPGYSSLHRGNTANTLIPLLPPTKGGGCRGRLFM